MCAGQMTCSIYLVTLLGTETRQWGVEVVATSVLAGTIARAAQESAVNGFPKPLIPRMHCAFHSPFGTPLQAKPSTKVLGPVSPLAQLFTWHRQCALSKGHTVHVGRTLLTSATQIMLYILYNSSPKEDGIDGSLWAACSSESKHLCACKPNFS